MRIAGRETKSPELTISPHIAGKPYKALGTAAPSTIVNDGLGRSVALYVAVTRIATALASASVELVRGEDNEPVPSRFAETFNLAPNPAEGGVAFRWRLVSQALLFAEGAFVQIDGAASNPRALWLLDPRYTQPIPGREALVAGYEVTVPGTSRAVRLEPEEVVHIKMPHPLDPFSSLTPLGAAALAIDTDYHAARYNSRFLDADGMPAVLLTTPQELGDDERDEIIAELAGDQLAQGYDRAGRAYLMAGVDGLAVHELAANPRDAQYVQGRTLAQSETMLAYGTPRSVAGDASERTFANADAEEAMWYRWVVEPIGALIASAFDRVVAPETETRLRFNFTGSALLRREEAEAREQNRADLIAGAILIDEYRASVGREPLPGGAGARTVTILGAREVETKAADSPPPDAISWGHFTVAAARLADRRSDAEARQAQAEATIARRLGAYISRQREVVLAKLQGSKQFREKFADLRSRGEVYLKAYDPNRMFDLGTWNARLEEDLKEVLGLIVGDAGAPVASAFGASFNTADPRIGAGIEARTAKIVTPPGGGGFNEQTLGALRTSLAEGAVAGEDLAALVERVEGIYGAAETYRLERIARTEALGGTNLGRFEAAQQAGIGGTKTWLAVGDHRTRLEHAEADGQEVALAEAFDVGGETLLYPGEDGASPENVINCRCEAVIEGPEGELI